MTINEQVVILRSANINTIIGMSVHNALRTIDFAFYDVNPHRKYDIVKRTIANLKLSWDDDPELTQSCFSKHLNDLFNV